MNWIKTFFTKRWFLLTTLVLVAMGVCIRLGIWQLDRLEKRRAFNARVTEQLQAAPLSITDSALVEDLFGMEYRQVRARGEYDHQHQIILKNQYYGNEWGVHLITPLRLEGSKRVVLVDRGWISAADFEQGDLGRFDETGMIEISGVIRRPQSKAEIGSRSDPIPAPGDTPLKAWFFVNIEQIRKQMPYDLLEVYIQQAKDPNWSGLPYRTQPELKISEGPHFGYALQWFTFAGLLLFGYPFFIKRSMGRAFKKKPTPASMEIAPTITAKPWNVK